MFQAYYFKRKGDYILTVKSHFFYYIEYISSYYPPEIIYVHCPMHNDTIECSIFTNKIEFVRRGGISLSVVKDLKLIDLSLGITS